MQDVQILLPTLSPEHEWSVRLRTITNGTVNYYYLSNDSELKDTLNAAIKKYSDDPEKNKLFIICTVFECYITSNGNLKERLQMWIKEFSPEVLENNLDSPLLKRMTFILTKLKQITSKASLWAELGKPNGIRKIYTILESSIPTRTLFEKWLACKDHIQNILPPDNYVHAYYSYERHPETQQLYSAIAQDTILTEKQWFTGQDKFWNSRKDSREIVEIVEHNTPTKKGPQCILRLSEAFESIPKDLQDKILDHFEMPKDAWKKENFTIQSIEKDLYYGNYYIKQLYSITDCIQVHLDILSTSNFISQLMASLLKDYFTVITEECKKHFENIPNTQLSYCQNVISEYVTTIIDIFASLLSRFLNTREMTKTTLAESRKEVLSASLKHPVCTIIQPSFAQEAEGRYLVLINNPKKPKQTVLIDFYPTSEKSENNRTSSLTEITEAITLESSKSISGGNNNSSFNEKTENNDAHEGKDNSINIYEDRRNIYVYAQNSVDATLLAIMDDIATQYGRQNGIDIPAIFAEIYCCGHFQALMGQFFPGAHAIELKPEEDLEFTPRAILFNLNDKELKSLQNLSGFSCKKLKEINSKDPTYTQLHFNQNEIAIIRTKLEEHASNPAVKQLSKKLKSNYELAIEAWYNQNAEEDYQFYLTANQQMVSNRVWETIAPSKTASINSTEPSFADIISSINATHEIFHPKEKNWQTLIEQACFQLGIEYQKTTAFEATAFKELEHYMALLLTNYISTKLTSKQKAIVLYAFLTDSKIDHAVKQAIYTAMGFIHLSDAKNALKSYYEKGSENILALNELVKNINNSHIPPGDVIIHVGQITNDLKRLLSAKIEASSKPFSITDFAVLGVQSYNIQKIGERIGGSKTGSARGFAYEFAFEAVLEEDFRKILLYALLICNNDGWITKLQKHVVASIQQILPEEVTQEKLDELKSVLNLSIRRVELAENIRNEFNMIPTLQNVNEIINMLHRLIAKTAKAKRLNEKEASEEDESTCLDSDSDSDFISTLIPTTTTTLANIHYTQSHFLLPPPSSFPRQQTSVNTNISTVTLRNSRHGEDTS